MLLFPNYLGLAGWEDYTGDNYESFHFSLGEYEKFDHACARKALKLILLF